MKRSLFFILLCICSAATIVKKKPTIFLIGDSTVKNGSGTGDKGLWGWGDFLHEQFDTTKIHIENHARGGRSSRTYQSEGLWDNVRSKVKSGDYIIMQFGHNDAGAINDTLRARGTIRGTGEETSEIDNLITKKHEVVHSYGWYMRKYIRDTKAKGGIPIVCSLVARNNFENGKVVRATESYALWAMQIAREEKVTYIDLNNLVATEYEKLGPEYVGSKLFIEDHTHTTKEGAQLNAKLVADGIRSTKVKSLKKFLTPPSVSSRVLGNGH